MSNMDILKDFAEAVKATGGQTTKPYDTPATVIRVEGDIVWVHIPGGVDETPVRHTIAAKPGDVVQIRVSGGSACIVGNETAPPTDDTKAEQAIKKAEEAGGTASNFVTDTKDGIFVHPKNNKDDGVRITDAIEIIKGGMSFFRAWIEGGLAKVRVGKADAGHTNIDSNGMRVYGGDGSELLANIGYGEGESQSGETEIAPYYTFGSRIDPTEIGLPQVIGNYSFVEGYGNSATSIGTHAGGSGCEANAPWSFAFGGDLLANYPTQFVIGNFNEPEDKAFIIGGGMLSDNPEDRENIFTVDWDGVAWAAGGYSGLVTTEDVTVSISYAAGTIGSRGATESLGTTVKANHTYIGAYIIDNRNTSAFNATVQGNGPNNTAHLCAYRATGNAVSNASVTVRKVWLKTGA